MLKLRYIHAKEWCQHHDRRIDFAIGTTCLVGPNGAGKSNLLYAGFTALTGELLTDDTIADNINYMSEWAEVECGFSINGVDGVVTRKYTAPFIRDETGKVVGRDAHKSTATFKFGDQPKVSGASKVTKQLAETIGLSSTIIRDHIIVPQGKLLDLLFKPKQERIKAFQSLVPALGVAEKKRVDIRTELERNPPISIGLSRDEIQRMLEAVKKKAQELDGEVKQLKAKSLSFGDLDGHRKRIAKAEMAKLAEADLHRTTPALETARSRHQTLMLQHNEVTQRIRTLEAAVASGKAKADEARRLLHIADQNAQAFNARASAQAQLETTQRELQSRAAPVPYVVPDWFAKVQQDREGLAASVAAADKVLAFLRQGKTVCPTCGTQFTDLTAQRGFQEQALAKLRPMLQEHDRAISEVNALVQTSQRAIQEHALWLRGVETRMQQLTSTLATMPKGEPINEQQRQLWLADIGLQDQLSTDLDRGRAAASTAATQVATAAGEVTRLERDVQRLQQETEGKVSDSTLEEMRKALAEAEEVNRRYLTLSGEFTAHERELERLHTQFEAVEADKTRAVSTDTYRGMLDKAFTVLHRDQLPQNVMESYLGDLNRINAKYLDYFGNPFSVMIPRDFDISVTRPDGYTYPAARESGGRKCVLSIVFRFAINQLFATQVGIIVLDEPTAYLDEDNVAYVAGIVDQMHRIESETGLQIIMITHEKGLVSSFDHVEEIGQ